MACDCNIPSCTTCNPCCPPNPCTPCGVNACPPSPPIACPDDCEIPIYTNDECTYQTTTCITWEDPGNTCVGIVTGNSLTMVVNSLIDYIKTTFDRLTPADASIAITPIDDDCDDSAEIGVVIDPNVDNQLELTLDGLYVPPTEIPPSTVIVDDTASVDLEGDGSIATPIIGNVKISADIGNVIITINPDGLRADAAIPDPVDVCAEIDLAFGTDLQQQNDVDQTTYNFLAMDDSLEEGCKAIKLSPPTGFAVSGADRESAFGAMEWYETLTLANFFAESGETVLIYKDTVEHLITKDGVNYQGIGVHSVGAFTATDTINTLSNLIITGDTNVSQDSVIDAYGCVVRGKATIGGNAKWIGGQFKDPLWYLRIQESAIVQDIYSEKAIGINAGASLINSNIRYTGTNMVDTIVPIIAAVTLTSDAPNGRVLLMNLNIYATQVEGLYTVNAGVGSSYTMINVHSYSPGFIGIRMHRGGGQDDQTVITTGVIGRSDTTAGVFLIMAETLSATRSFNKPVITGVIGVSIDGPGISCINADMKNCHGHSTNHYGIQIGGSDYENYNSMIIDCTAESQNNDGLVAYRDIYISGGTFITMSDNPVHSPIFLSGPNNTIQNAEGYFIVGAKTIAHNPASLAIKGNGTYPQTARISGCDFTNKNVLTDVPGIDPVIVVRHVVHDAYGNRT